MILNIISNSYEIFRIKLCPVLEKFFTTNTRNDKVDNETSKIDFAVVYLKYLN